MPYKNKREKNKENSENTIVFFFKNINEREMSDEEHSESEFYYPDEDNEVMENKESHCIDEAASDAVLNSENTDSQEDIDNFVKAQKSENTVKKTTSDMNNFYRYLAQINKRYVNILNLQAKELDHLLSKFFKDFRKVNGEEYEPDTFSGFQRSIQRFLTDGKSRYKAHLHYAQFLVRYG